MNETTTQILYAALTLFLVTDPLGNVAIWTPLLKDVAPERKRTVILRECLIAVGILIAFMFFGPASLNLMQIQQPALPVAGGVVMFLIALRMLFPQHGGIFGDEVAPGEPLIVPLAMPLLAGPSAMATVTLLSTQIGWRLVLPALAINGVMSIAILTQSDWLSRKLGQRGTTAIERLMGMLLTIMAVQMILSGLKEFWANAR